MTAAVLPEPHKIFTEKCGHAVFTADQMKACVLLAIESATLAAQDKPLTGDDILVIIEMLQRHQTFNYEPNCPVVAMCWKLENMRNGIKQ